jgi:hypothetical protein
MKSLLERFLSHSKPTTKESCCCARNIAQRSALAVGGVCGANKLRIQAPGALFYFYKKKKKQTTGWMRSRRAAG